MITYRPLLMVAFGMCACAATYGQATSYDDYIGAGHSEGITVSTSSDYTRQGWTRQATGDRTIDGGGLDAKKMEASRFLSQAAFGGTRSEVETLAANLDFEGWIDWQAELPEYSMLSLSEEAWQKARQVAQSNGQNPANIDWHSRHFHAALWQSALTRPDVLRQKMALALSEILVVSTNSVIGQRGDAFAAYYDVLRKHALGSYRDLLVDVSTHPVMGVYLTHFRNPKTNPEENTFPDENYAREIMQLFTIGLYELHPNGEVKHDGQGNPIPSYGQNDVRELSKVFTGLGAGEVNEVGVAEGRSPDFTIHRRLLSYIHPMVMYNEEHEPGSKSFLGQSVNNADGMMEIEAAIDILMEHPNTAPFVSKKLIQHMVSSNPSPGYVADVAQVFANDGQGERGNLLAVAKAILLHDEARDCMMMNLPGHGKLRAPTYRYMHMAKAININTFEDLHWPHHAVFYNATLHFPFTSPSVFNFYLPDFQPNGPVADMDLVAPEFEIHNATTSIGFVNEVDDWTRRNQLFKHIDIQSPASIHYASYGVDPLDNDVLLNLFDVLLTHGRLSDSTREIITEALNGYNPSDTSDLLKERFDLALFLFLISPDYNILK